MVSRLRVPTDGGPEGHGDTPPKTCAARATGRLREFSPGERHQRVFVLGPRYNTTPGAVTITGCVPALYQLIAGFRNRREDSTMVDMHARAP